MKDARPEIVLAVALEASGPPALAAYEHPLVIRLCHWVNAVALFVLIGSGLRIFAAFPSFGPRVPERDLLKIPDALTLGDWLGGALQWHITFAWIYAITGLVYVSYLLFRGRYRRVLFTGRDLSGVWPMLRHYFFRGRKTAIAEPYNPLQKAAYSLVILLGVLSVLTGMVLYNPVQFSLLASLMGGFHWARLWHFGILCAIVLFIAGHVILVVLHGWNNFVSMLTGWKKNPEYLR